jgi:hypothetical protein
MEGGAKILTKDVEKNFKRAVFGGLNRFDAFQGTDAQITARVQQVLTDAPERFILGADCSLDATDLKIQAVIRQAHAFRQG